MKKLLFCLLTLAACVFTACSDEKFSEVNMRFEHKIYNLGTKPVEVKLLVKNSPASAEELPLIFEGTAEKEKDYKVSTEKLVVGGSQEMLSVTVTPLKKFTEQKSVVIRLANDPSIATILEMVSRSDIMYSFVKESEQMGQDITVTVALYKTSDGSSFPVEDDMTVGLEVESSSTAKEGQEFEFVNKTAVIKRGKSEATFTLKTLKRDKIKNQIVLKTNLTEEDGFYAGRYASMKVKIITGYAYDLAGEWQMNEFICDKKYFEQMYEGWLPESQMAKLPEYNANDTYTFKSIGEDKYELTTSLESNCKYYFQPTTTGVFDGELKIRGLKGGTARVQLMKLSDVNRFFSETKQSTDREAYLGLRNIVDEVTGETLLDVFIVDYDPTDFLTDFYGYGMVGSTKPTMPDLGTFIRFTLKKKK